MAYKILQQTVEPEDATTKYAKYLAEKLNHFDAITKSILIHKFNNLIFEAEMNMYSTSPSPSSSSNSSTPSMNFLSHQEIVSPSPSISPSPTHTQQNIFKELEEFVNLTPL